MTSLKLAFNCLMLDKFFVVGTHLDKTIGFEQGCIFGDEEDALR